MSPDSLSVLSLVLPFAAALAWLGLVMKIRPHLKPYQLVLILSGMLVITGLFSDLGRLGLFSS